jgi:hypothetical protein
MIRISPRANPDSGLMDRVTDFARQVKPEDFPVSGSGIRWPAADRSGEDRREHGIGGRAARKKREMLTAIKAPTHPQR